MKKKCYSKELSYVVPTIRCNFCNTHIKSGDKLYSVVLTWGNGKSACEECYNKYEIDWTIHERKEIDEDIEEYEKNVCNRRYSRILRKIN